MIQVRNQNLSVTLEAFFHKPAPYDSGRFKSIAESALEKYGEFGLRCGQVWQRQGDQLFDYELSFTLFNGQGQFRLSAERFSLNFQNARGERDVQIILECMVRAAQCVGASDSCKLNLQAASHAIFDNEGQCAAFFANFADASRGIIDGGRIIFVREEGWMSPVRLSVERSVAFKEGAFLALSTERTSVANLETFRQIADTFGKALDRLELELKLE
jgi:hypothetical protein